MVLKPVLLAGKGQTQVAHDRADQQVVFQPALIFERLCADDQD